MSDILERLRSDRIIGTPTLLLREAADEIEGLRREINIAWAAGIFEGEGSICGAQKFKNALNADGKRRRSGYRWWLVVHSTDHDVLRKFAAVVGRGSFFGPYPDRRGTHYKPQLRWATTTLEESQAVLRLLLSYLGERRQKKASECLEATYVRRMRKEAA